VSTALKTAPPLLLVPFREVRHDQPDDVLYYEPINVRARLHQWTIPAHRHEGLHQFQFLAQGSVQATLDGEPCALKAPMALMVPPGVVHGFVYERDSGGHQVTLPSGSLRAYFAHAPALLEQLAQPILVSAMAGDAAACAGIFDALAAEFAAGHPGRAEALQGHAMLLALWFLRREAAALAPLRRQALRDTLLQRYRALLEQHVRQQEPVTFYAARLGVTADHLSRVCRATAGISALDLMHERLLLEARRLLVYTPAPVVDVARELGFDDPGYFSRFFSKLTGQSPSAYRAAVAQGNGLSPGHPDQPKTPFRHDPGMTQTAKR
jgi:AraC family transcriptional regulator, transcriptional activator of pobA